MSKAEGLIQTSRSNHHLWYPVILPLVHFYISVDF